MLEKKESEMKVIEISKAVAVGGGGEAVVSIKSRPGIQLRKRPKVGVPVVLPKPGPVLL